LKNIAYLSDDRRREQPFLELQSQVGTRAQQILAAPESALLRRGLPRHPAHHVRRKIGRVAQLATDDFDGDLEGPSGAAIGAGQARTDAVSGVGAPGAEKILLLARSHAVLGSTRTALRVLTRSA